MAKRLARISGEQYPILYLVAFAFEVCEEIVQPFEIAVSRPQQLFLLSGEFVVGPVYRKIKLVGRSHQLLFPPLHGIAAPGGYRVVVDASGLVGHDELFVDSDNLAIPFANRAGPYRIVERKHMLGRNFESHPVGLKTGREDLRPVAVLLLHDYLAAPAAVTQRLCDRIAQPALRLLVIADLDTVHHDVELPGLFNSRPGDILFDGDGSTVGINALDTLLDEQGKPFYGTLTCCGPDGGTDEYTSAGLSDDVGDDILYLITPHLPTCDGRVGPPYTGEKQFQVVVYLGRRTDRRTGIARINFLLYRNRGSDAAYRIYIGFVDTAEKLAGIGGKALDIPALPLGEQGIESQRGFTGT